MKHIFLLATLLAAAPAAAQQQDASKQEIVVTGTRLSDTRKALEACLARNCPPDEDVNASLAHAENLFVAGEYHQARKTVKDSISRNDRHARKYPEPVSDLYRANSRISIHLGEGKDYEWSTWGIKRALKAGLPDDDLRILGADLEVAGMQAGLKRFDAARITYRRVERKAMELGRPDLAATARIRQAWLSHLNGHTATTRSELLKVAKNPDPKIAAQRLAALVLLARLDRREGKIASSDALLSELRKVGFTKPTLLYSPPLDLNVTGRDEGSGSVTRQMAVDDFEDQWADVGFWVRPDGRVADVEIIRQKGQSQWLKPVLKSISGRIYAPLKGASEEGSFRVERYSYTSLWADRTGTRLRQRAADGRVEFLDLTADPEVK